MKRFSFILLMLATLAFSCTREPFPGQDPSETGFKTTHYKVQVSSSDDSKATTADNDTKYVFQATDALYVSSTATDPESGGPLLFGVLKLISGSGETTAYFEGDLVNVNEFEPASDTPINVTLVSSGDRIHTTGGGKLTGTAYPSNEYGTSLADAVEKFSNFTCSTNFGNTRFTLSQNSSFVICKIKTLAADLPDATSVTASLECGGNTIWEGIVTSTVNGLVGKLDFVIPLEGGSVTLSSASLSCEWTDALDAPQSHSFDLKPGTLAANNYYTIERSTIYFDGFHIKGTVDGTTITFNYNYADDGIEYSFDEGLTWTPYTASFELDADEEICVRGNRANYANNGGDQYGTPGDKPIFTATNKVYISGNIMSLLADKDNLVASAFHGAFSKGSSTAVNYIDINPNRDLTLPSTTLPTSCYQQMFRNCTSLTRTPVFRAESVAYRCCYNMFRQCSNLKDASGIELPASILAIDCYRELFRQCGELKTIPQDFLPATTLAQGCYQQMFQLVTKIVTAPDLPAPELVKDCYSEMFSGCSALENVTCLATSISASNCLNKWLNSVKSNGTFTRPQSMAGQWPSGISGIPTGWNQADYVPPQS